MNSEALEKIGFKPIKVGKDYYIFTIIPVPVTGGKGLEYAVRAINVKTGKTPNVVEYIEIEDVLLGKVRAINKVKRNLIKKLENRK